MIYGDLINFELFKTPSDAASAATTPLSSPTLSIFMTSRVGDDDDDNDVLTINNFDENFPNKNQIIFDTLQRKVHTDDNDLLSIEKCTRTTNICGGIGSGTNNSSSSSSGTDTNTTGFATSTTEAPQLELTIATTDMIATTTTTTAKMSMSNISTSLSPSSSSSSLTLLSSSSSSPPSSLLQQRLLSRPKRYLSFPEGSSFSVCKHLCVCMKTVGVYVCVCV